MDSISEMSAYGSAMWSVLKSAFLDQVTHIFVHLNIPVEFELTQSFRSHSTKPGCHEQVSDRLFQAFHST